MVLTKVNNDCVMDVTAFPKNRTKTYEVQTSYKGKIAGFIFQILFSVLAVLTDREGKNLNKRAGAIENHSNIKSCFDKVKTKSDQNNLFFHV